MRHALKYKYVVLLLTMTAAPSTAQTRPILRKLSLLLRHQHPLFYTEDPSRQRATTSIVTPTRHRCSLSSPFLFGIRHRGGDIPLLLMMQISIIIPLPLSCTQILAEKMARKESKE